ncbi:acetate/propionate family kinase [Verrucomicrobiaceae bacterium N1E253]|uniref:Acetate kinase n=1 Tax=Oceaniferula marina TaxID=2748318 RepID=A0A851GFL3_9BACT|nr:acetate/propionate family kinase [Oceaniferula marina]NWK56196.1 acetate/propionate family kinase [Oceaniferula marina]
MHILIANLGSTSFKYRLYQMNGQDECVLASGGFERVTDYAEVIQQALAELVDQGHLKSIEDIDAVGFKTVLGKNLSGCVDADEKVIAALDGFREVAPAHNPPYAAGIKLFQELLPQSRLVALFETAFYQWIPESASRYAVPQSWYDAGIRRYGFHGASHKFVAERSAELMGREDVAEVVRNLYQDGPRTLSGKPLRVISFHLGGSSSVTGIRNGVAVGTSMGFSPQSGLPQNNRVGDLDSGAIPFAIKTLGISMEEAEQTLTKKSGLLGVSGVSNDLRDIRQAAAGGNPDAQLALDQLIHSARQWAASYLFDLGGLDALVFTAGIGENNAWLREAICADLEDFGVEIDVDKNNACQAQEAIISSDQSKVKIIVIPANEELVLAREVTRKIS